MPADKKLINCSEPKPFEKHFQDTYSLLIPNPPLLSAALNVQDREFNDRKDKDYLCKPHYVALPSIQHA